MPGLTLHDSTMRALETSLGGLATRQKVIGNNLANIDTPGFKASEVSFAATLAEATNSGRDLKLVSTDPRHLGIRESEQSLEITTNRDTSQRLDGNNVDVEKEMENLAETAMHYQAVARVVSRRLGMLRQVVGGGR